MKLIDRKLNRHWKRRHLHGRGKNKKEASRMALSSFILHPSSFQAGFTLLEVMIVIFILGMMTAMAWSSLGHLDNDRKRETTLATMERIRKAIMGPNGIYDQEGRRIIGGYVGDMRKFPDLWEARAEVKPSFTGSGWSDYSPSPGLGQGPDYTVNPDHVFFRPSGEFVKGTWHWLTPFRKLSDDPAGFDHIGGLETENEGQPRGLWTFYTEDLRVDLPGHPAPGHTEGENWKGPYIQAPREETWQAGNHYAKTDSEYEDLAPAWIDASGWETWEDGNYGAALGELFDDKEKFRLLNNESRFSDGWGRSLRFFITQDPDRTGSLIFWILSEGPDFDARYPAKGTCTGHAWTKDPLDTMAKAYDETLEENRDNIVMKIYSHEYETVFEQEEQDREDRTVDLLERVRRALVGKSPHDLNTGYTGELLEFPCLFQWETDRWDDRDGSDIYTKGQPRGLWTRTPNSADSTDDLSTREWGIGWSKPYIPVPEGLEQNQVIRDAWGREILFFKDTAAGAILVLSRGRDGQFDFGTVNTEKTDPLAFTELVDIDSYDPSLTENQDNIVLTVRSYEFSPGYLTVGNLTVLNAAAGITKARLFREGTPAGDPIETCTSLTDEDGDGSLDDCSLGAGPGNPFLDYSDISSEILPTGARYLAVWNDTDANGQIDPGEGCKTMIFNVLPQAGTGWIEQVRLDTADFQPY